MPISPNSFDDDRIFLAVVLGQDAIEQGGLASTQIAVSTVTGMGFAAAAVFASVIVSVMGNLDMRQSAATDKNVAVHIGLRRRQFKEILFKNFDDGALRPIEVAHIEGAHVFQKRDQTAHRMGDDLLALFGGCGGRVSGDAQ